MSPTRSVQNVNDCPRFDLFGAQGSRIGAQTRGAIWLGLCLVLFAGVAAACGGSKASGPGDHSSPGSSPGSATSAQPPAVSFDPAAFESDSGGFGTSGSTLTDAGYTERYTQSGEGIDHLGEAFVIITNRLPKAVDLNQVKPGAPGSIPSEVYVQWQPNGRRDTVLPPGNHGERIYELDVDLGPYLKGGDAVAYVWFLSRAEGDALDKNDLSATPKTYPSQAYTFTLDKATAAALLDVFWVKGVAPSD
jgi:hypothetical protein